MSLIHVIVVNPVSGDELPPFAASEIVSLENVSFDHCIDSCREVIDKEPHHWSLTIRSPGIIILTSEDERASVSEVKATLGCKLITAKNDTELG